MFRRPSRLPSVLAILATVSAATAQVPFYVAGPGASIPASGTGGGGAWPNVLPPNPTISTAYSAVPEDACRFTELSIYGLSHTWVGDLQIALRSPNGRLYNIVHRPGFDGSNNGSSGDCSGGTYTFVSDQQSNAPHPPSSGAWGSGTYKQWYGSGISGTWPGELHAIDNIDIARIGVETGVWSLFIYDWGAGDTGQISGWNLRGVRGIPATFRGPGGPIPAAGSGGGGAWPNTLPPSPTISSTAYTPASFFKVSRVAVEGLTHTWAGDLQFVLRGPSNPEPVNLISRLGFTGSGNGNPGDILSGNFIIVPVATTGGATPPSSGDWLPGTWWQNFGVSGGYWPSGTHQIDNYSLESQFGYQGSWQLEIYDWEGGDVGTFSGWRVEGYYLPVGPTSYCNAGTSTNGCTPTLVANGTPSVSYMWPCSVTAVGVEGQKSGMIFYSVKGPQALAWGSSTLCLKPPTQRTAALNSGGAVGSCQGALTLDWNQFRLSEPAALGNPFALGESVFFQGWYRDPPSSKGTNLTDALILTHVP